MARKYRRRQAGIETAELHAAQLEVLSKIRPMPVAFMPDLHEGDGFLEASMITDRGRLCGVRMPVSGVRGTMINALRLAVWQAIEMDRIGG